MALVLAYGIVLLVCVSLSGVAARTVLSTALLFLAAGAVIGPGGLGIASIGPNDPIVVLLAHIALFTVLFTDGQRANVPALRQNWRLSGRALGLGMPLTMVGIAVPAHLLAGLGWSSAFLLGAILSPTDPVFAAALVGRPDVPLRLRRLLNVESGLNDGIALPFVLIFIASAGHQGLGLATVVGQLLLGLLIGFAFPSWSPRRGGSRYSGLSRACSRWGRSRWPWWCTAPATTPTPTRIWRRLRQARRWPPSTRLPRSDSSPSAMSSPRPRNSPPC